MRRSEKRTDENYKEEADWFCQAHIEKKRFIEGLFAWNDRGKESQIKEEAKIHGRKRRRDWILDCGGRAEAG